MEVRRWNRLTGIYGLRKVARNDLSGLRAEVKAGA